MARKFSKISQEAFSAWSKEAQKEKEKCESGQDLTEEICAVAEAVIPTKNIRDKASLSRIFVFVLCP